MPCNVSIGDCVKLLSGRVDMNLSQGDSAAYPETEAYEKGFGAYYEKEIKPMFDEVETLRIAKLRNFQNTLMISLLSALIILFIGGGLTLYIFSGMKVGSSYDRSLLPFGLSFTIAGGILYWGFSPARAYTKEVKSKIHQKIINFVGSDFSFNPEGIKLIGSVGDYDIVPSYDKNECEDYIQGIYKDVLIEIEETLLTQTRGSGKNRRVVTKFDGVVVLLDMNKNFTGKTIVRTDQGSIGNWLASTFESLEEVKLEDPVFEKMFQVYSTDQVEARYLLTTAFIERVLQLESIFNSGSLIPQKLSRIQLSFFKSKLLITIPLKRDLFEPGSITRPALQHKDIKKFLQEIDLIFQIIDILKLNMKIGL